MLWAALAVLLVLCYIMYHTRSAFISISSMWMILFSFPITLVIYKDICGVTMVAALHLMVVFVILGISADNIFVTWDAWKQSNTFPQYKGNLNKRMAYSFRRTSQALLATSSTTAFAFMSNGFSTLMPISAFGWFAFIIIPVNYVLIVLYYPAYLIVYEKYVRNWEDNFIDSLYGCVTCRSCREIKMVELLDQLKNIDKEMYDFNKKKSSKDSGTGKYSSASDIEKNKQ